MVWLLVALVIGVNLLAWGLVGVLRLLDEAAQRRWGRRSHSGRRSPRGRRPSAPLRPTPPVGGGGSGVHLGEVAVLMAAHDEERVIGASLAALTSLVPAGDVHVVSDFSRDETVAIAQAAGVHVLQTPTNVGKARALAYALDQARLLDRYRAVMILDADTQLAPDYFVHALPMLDDPEVVAVAGCAHTRWQPALGAVGTVVVAHRQRIYTLTQMLLKYGQTWRGISATHIVPGFASIYRSSALRQIEIDAPGLVIEDFNMTFEIHTKRLGRIAFHPGARAYTQDPAHVGDYISQTRRWCLGLWQTIGRHRPRRLVFGASLAAMVTELVTSSIVFVLLPAVTLLLLIGADLGGTASLPVLGPAGVELSTHISLTQLLLGVVIPDYLLTVAVALKERRARFLLAGLAFLPMRVTDAYITLSSLPRAFHRGASGRWTSPTRRDLPPAPGAHRRHSDAHADRRVTT